MSPFNRQTFYRDIPVWGVFRLDQGAGCGGFFVKTPTGPKWLHGFAPTGCPCIMTPEAVVTPATLSISVDE